MYGPAGPKEPKHVEQISRTYRHSILVTIGAQSQQNFRSQENQ